MARQKISPQLADLTQDIAGSIPTQLINNWVYSNQDKAAHADLIKPYIVSGTVVSTDSSGLSRLSQSKSLFEVIKLISHPKQLIFSNGLAIGGSPIGIWAADNTQMFYPKEVSLEEIINQMAHVFKLLQNYDLKIGMAIHSGEFINIGGGLYGEDADYVEELAESYAAGGEMLITSSVLSQISNELKTNATLKEGARGAYIIDYSNLENFKHSDIDKSYPIPFSQDFYENLTKTEISDTHKLKDLEKQYLSEKIVILLKIFHTDEEFLLSELTDWIEANALINQIVQDHNIFKVKSNGSLGIFISDDKKRSIEFAKDLKKVLEENNFVSNIGICKGEVLLCNLEDENWDIAGEPVNIASKIAEDSEEKNKILIEESVESEEGKDFRFEISGVEIIGKVI